MLDSGTGATTSPMQRERDLWWSINSPALITQQSQLLQSAEKPEQARRLPVFTNGPIPPKDHRVGRYFESLVEFWLSKQEPITLIAKNHPIQREGRTWGELDFVFRMDSGPIFHWETAVKFYLYDQHHRQHESHFIGPNTNDTFERKMERVFSHQLELTCPTLPQVDHHEPHIKGRIFYHPKQAPPIVLPKHLSPHHLRGLWLRINELKDFLSSRQDWRFQVIQKPYWLAELALDPKAPPLHNASQLVEVLTTHFSASERSILCAAFRHHTPHGIESERFFVVREDWPRETI